MRPIALPIALLSLMAGGFGILGCFARAMDRVVVFYSASCTRTSKDSPLKAARSWLWAWAVIRLQLLYGPHSEKFMLIASLGWGGGGRGGRVPLC